MKKAFIIIIGILLLAACRPATKDIRAQDFRYGTEGLAIRFVPNLPPFRLFDNEDFNAVIEVENRGTFTIGQGGDKIYISGFDPSIITGISTYGEQLSLLEGRDVYKPQGDVDTVAFKGRVQYLKQKKIDRYPTTILATACYTYETVATANMCLDPNPYSATIKQRVCTPGAVSLGGGQGAPIAVTTVEEDASPGRARFKIHIQNAGKGEVFRYGLQYLGKCSPYSEGLAFDESGYVQLADIMIAGVSIKSSCKPLDVDHIRLDQSGSAVIYCSLDSVRGQAAFVSPLTVILRYGYRDSTYTNIEIIPSS